MTLDEVVKRPHLFLACCAAFALIGGIGSTLAGQLNTVAITDGVFVWVGVIIMLRHAWMKKPTWPAMLRAKQFWIGVCLIAAGNFVFFEFSK